MRAALFYSPPYLLAATGAVPRSPSQKLMDYPDVKDFGAVIDNVTNDTTAAANYAAAYGYVELLPGTYRASSFPTTANRTYHARGTVTFSFFNSSNPVYLSMGSNCVFDGIAFSSTETNLANQRISIEGASNVTVRRCTFTGFRDTSTSNAWGLYIANSSDILLDSPGFANNTQSDLALVDSVTGLTVINAYNTVDNGVNMNVEPNGAIGSTGVNVIGGHFRLMRWLENSTAGYQSKYNNVCGAVIDTLMYDGAGVSFRNCKISSIVQEGTSLTTSFSGPLMIDTCDLQANLISDPYLFDISDTDATCYWTSYSSSTYPVKRYEDAVYGKYTRLNDSRSNQEVIITPRAYIPCVAGESFMTFMRARCDNTGTTSQTGHLSIEWYDATPTLLLTTAVTTTRGPAGAITEWCNDIGIVKAPAGATQFKYRIRNSNTGNSIACHDVSFVGMYRYNLLAIVGQNGNMPAVIGEASKPVFNKTYYQNQVPVGVANYGGGLVGERIVRATPVVGQPKAWSCTAIRSGNGASGTWVSEGNL